MRSRSLTLISFTARMASGLLALVVATGADDVRAQTTATEGFVLTGTVRDAASGTPVRGAFVSLAGEDWGVLTDEAGAFALPDVSPATQSVEVEAMGYVDLRLTARLVEGEPLIIDLAPKPVVLEGLRIVADRFERRRKATPVSVQVADRDALLNSGTGDLMQFLQSRLGVFITSACGSSFSFYCVRARGRTVAPVVYIDEFPAIAGLDQLAAYQPHELFMVEVYGRGRHIRAYTSWFMERAAEQRLNAIPLYVY